MAARSPFKGPQPQPQKMKEIRFADLPYNTKKELLRVMHQSNVDFRKVLYGNYLETKIKFRCVKYGQSKVIVTREDIERLYKPEHPLSPYHRKCFSPSPSNSPEVLKRNPPSNQSYKFDPKYFKMQQNSPQPKEGIKFSQESMAQALSRSQELTEDQKRSLILKVNKTKTERTKWLQYLVKKDSPNPNKKVPVEEIFYEDDTENKAHFYKVLNTKLAKAAKDEAKMKKENDAKGFDTLELDKYARKEDTFREENEKDQHQIEDPHLGKQNQEEARLLLLKEKQELAQKREQLQNQQNEIFLNEKMRQEQEFDHLQDRNEVSTAKKQGNPNLTPQGKNQNKVKGFQLDLSATKNRSDLKIGNQSDQKNSQNQYRISNFDPEDSQGPNMNIMSSRLNQYSYEGERASSNRKRTQANRKNKQNRENCLDDHSHAGSGCPCDWSMSQKKKKRKRKANANANNLNKDDHPVFQDKSQILDMIKNQGSPTKEEQVKQLMYQKKTENDFQEWQEKFRPLENNNELMLELYLQNKKQKINTKGLSRAQQDELKRLKELDRLGMLNNGKFGTKTWRLPQRSLSPLNPKRNLSKRSTNALNQFQLCSKSIKKFEQMKPQATLSNLATQELLSFYGGLKLKVNKDNTRHMRINNEEVSKSFILKGNF